MLYLRTQQWWWSLKQITVAVVLIIFCIRYGYAVVTLQVDTHQSW